MRTLSPKGLAGLVLAGLVLVGVGLAAGILYETSAGGKNFADVSTSACEEVTGSANLDEVDRIAPASASFDVSEEIEQRPGAYRANCKIDAEGEQILIVTIDLKGFGSFEEWDESMTNDRLIPAEGRDKLEAGDGGYSTPGAAGVHVPCTVAGDDESEAPEQMSMSVFVKASAGGDHREDLAAIAERAAGAAAAAAVCEQ